MKRNRLLFVLVAFVACAASFAQEKLMIELKNGQIVSYNVSDVNRFYFEGQGEALAANCGIEINDELVLTQEFALDVNYESGIDYVYIRAYLPEAKVEDYSDAVLVADLIENGVKLEKTTTVITAANMPEGKELTIVMTGFNAKGQHGPVYRHKVKTHVESEEPKAEVTSCKYNKDNFFYTIEIDDKKVLKYYLLEDLGFDLEFMNKAAFGMLFRQAIATDTERGEYYSGKNFTRSRPNGETHLTIATWALDFDLNYSGYIFYDVYYVDPNSSRMSSYGVEDCENNMTAYNKSELLKMIKNLNIRVVTAN